MKKIDKELQKKIEQYFLLFVIYSFLGWVIEVIIFVFLEHKIINRGLLIGPYCPIYGFGFLIIDLCLKKFKDKPFVLFIMAMAVATVLEYSTSLLLESIFGIQLWDYSQNFMNFNGRICLQTTLGFGVLALIIIYKVNPKLVELLGKIPETVSKYLAMVLGILMLLDACISYKVVFSFKGTLSKIGDSTQEMSAKVWQFIKNQNY